jgi:aspartyl-tRNA(Asn)/glutamyl-tRNA(Gln) amidotransferase subunit C
MPLGKMHIRQLADLARLNLSNTEIETLGSQLTSIVEHFHRLRAVDTASVTAAANEFETIGLRNDIIRPSMDRSLALANASEQDGEYIQVPGVIRR